MKYFLMVNFMNHTPVNQTELKSPHGYFVKFPHSTKAIKLDALASIRDWKLP